MTQEKRKYFGENGNDLVDAINDAVKTLETALGDLTSGGQIAYIPVGGPTGAPDGHGNRLVTQSYLDDLWSEVTTAQYQLAARWASEALLAKALKTALAGIKFWKDHGGK